MVSDRLPATGTRGPGPWGGLAVVVRARCGAGAAYPGGVDARRAGLRLTWLGAAAQVAGLGIDAVLHAADEGLAAREGIFTLSNPGHALFAVGTGLLVLGAFWSLVAPLLAGRGRALRVAAPLSLVAVMIGGTAFASSTSLGQGHDDAGSSVAGSHPHGDTTTTTALPGLAGAGGGSGAAGAQHGHGDGGEHEAAEQPLDRATREALAEQLVTAREVALAHRTVDRALLDGYVMVVPYVPLIGAHYMKFSLVDRKFDPEYPEMLLYDGTNADSQIVGLSYYVASTDEPEGFAGPNDHWHRHIGLCIDPERIVVIGGEKTTPEECAAMGGVKADGSRFWMVHAWVVPGWDSPDGVFSAEHRGL